MQRQGRMLQREDEAEGQVGNVPALSPQLCDLVERCSRWTQVVEDRVMWSSSAIGTRAVEEGVPAAEIATA